MNLKEFTEETIKQIVEGARAASYAMGEEKNGRLTSEHVNVEFDVAVTTNNEKSVEGGGGLMVASIFQAGGKFGSSRTRTEQTYSRIKFSIPVYIFNADNNKPAGIHVSAPGFN